MAENHRPLCSPPGGAGALVVVMWCSLLMVCVVCQYPALTKSRLFRWSRACGVSCGVVAASSSATSRCLLLSHQMMVTEERCHCECWGNSSSSRSLLVAANNSRRQRAAREARGRAERRHEIAWLNLRRLVAARHSSSQSEARRGRAASEVLWLRRGAWWAAAWSCYTVVRCEGGSS